MLQLFVVEPLPHLVPLLKNKGKFRISGSENTPAAARHCLVQCDLMLVSALFPSEAVLDLVNENQQRPFLTVITDIAEDNPLLVSFLEAGAAGYLYAHASPSEIAETLDAIQQGKPPLSQTVGTALVERMHELLALQRQRQFEAVERSEPDLLALTRREHEILALIQSGASNQDIAHELTIELGTVKNHVHNILKKLNVSRRDQAALLYEHVLEPK